MNASILDKHNVRVLFYSITILLMTLSIVNMVFAIFMIDVNADAAYYLGASRLILEGQIPFKDFPPGYTPLSFYIMALSGVLLGTSFCTALLTLYLLHIANAFIIYKIVKQYYADNLLAMFCSAFSLLLCLSSDGCRYILEPFVLFFGLLALYVIKKGTSRWTFLSGFLCFCSFWSKQYGLGFIFLAISSIFLEEGFKFSFVRKSLCLIMGFFIAMAIFVFYFFIQGVDPLALMSLSGGSYESDGIYGLIGGWKSLFITLPLLTVATVIIIVKLKQARNISLLIISFMGVFGFMLQFYVRFYRHYMILAMPFCVLMLFACINLFKSNRLKNIYIVLLLLAPVIPIYFTSKGILHITSEDTRKKQVICANAIKQLIPISSKDVYASIDLLPIMHINSYNPPLIAKYGLSNGFVRKAEEAEELIQAASYCMISERDLQKNHKYTSNIIKHLDKEFNKTPIESVESHGIYYIYVRK